jgi:hypothetical protein
MVRMNKGLTVKDLRDKLRLFPPNLPVKQYKNGVCIIIRDCSLVVSEELPTKCAEDIEPRPLFACIY